MFNFLNSFLMRFAACGIPCLLVFSLLVFRIADHGQSQARPTLGEASQLNEKNSNPAAPSPTSNLNLGSENKNKPTATGDGILEKRIRLELRHGFASEALQSLQTLEEQATCTWDDARIAWYRSLAYRLTGQTQKANRWLNVTRVQSHQTNWADQEFWSQNQRWSNPKRPNRFFVATFTQEQEKDEITEKRQTILGMVERIQNLQGIQKNKKGTILDDIDLATWELLLGEYTSQNQGVTLYSTSIENIDAGNEGLAQIELKIEMDPTLEDKISTEPLLAIRLDTARVRAKIFTQAKELSRKNEITRLNQLRTIVRTYRDLTEKLLSWQTYEAVGDSQKASEKAKESLQTLNQIFTEVNGKRDFHLFDEEPVTAQDDEFKIVQIEPVPFSDDSLSLFKGIKGLSLLKLIQDSPERNALLDQAESWAKAALNENANIAGLPAASDPDNLVAKLVLGMVSEQRGLDLALDQEPQNRAKAKENLQESQNTMKGFLELLKTKGYADSEKVTQQANHLFNSLQNPDYLRDQARQKAKAGEPETGRTLLQEGIKKHFSEALAIERIRFGIRAGGLSPAELLKEWQTYEGLQVIAKSSAESQLVLSEIANRWGMEVIGGKYPDQIKNAQDVIAQSLQTLKQQIVAAGDAKPLSIRLKASYSLGFALQWALDGLEKKGTSPKKPDIEEAYRMARDAEYYLLNELKGTKPEEDDTNHVLLREALVSAQLGNAHLSALYLEDWRDESQTFFAAAASEASKLQYTAPMLPLIAEPLLRHVFNRDGSDQIRLANEERLRRQMMSRCLEAGYVSFFGLPVEAAKQMNEAVRLASRFLNKKDNQESDQPLPSASELSLTADGFDAKVSLLDTVRAFGVLENIKATKYLSAIQKAVALASADRLSIVDLDALNTEILQECLDSIQSPLIGFAFSNALMKAAATLPLEVPIERKRLLLDFCKKSFEKTNQFLKADRLAARFPHLTENCQLAISDLGSPARFIQGVQDLIGQRRLPQAIALAKQALGLHPANALLWRGYFNTRIQVIKASSKREGLQEFLKDLEIARKNDYIGDFEGAYQLAVVSELSGDMKNALVFSGQAVTLASDGQEKTLAHSLNAKVMVASIRPVPPAQPQNTN